MYKITLSNGHILDNIQVNGDILISHESIDDSTFDHNLSPVDIERIGERSPIDLTILEGHHENMAYSILPDTPEGEWHFTLSDIPESEMRIAKMCSDIDYIALMNDIEL